MATSTKMRSVKTEMQVDFKHSRFSLHGSAAARWLLSILFGSALLSYLTMRFSLIFVRH